MFRRRHRLSGEDEFGAVFDHQLRKSRGPLTVFLLPTAGPEHRLGLSIGRRYGGAVARGRLKRLLREVFRLERAGLPRPSEGGAYDIVVTARRHEPRSLAQHRDDFVGAVGAAHRTHMKRRGEP